MYRTLLAIGMVTLLCSSGCIKRLEVITVFPDGSLDLRTSIEGDPDDFDSAATVPTAGSSWAVEDETETDDKGKTTLTRTASLQVPSNAPVPGSFLPPGTEVGPDVLAFPTSLEIERRAEGTYYHFRRVYKARSWARIEYFRKRLLETDNIKKLSEKPPADLTDDERKELVKALIAFEREKTSELLDEALERLDDAVPQDAWLATWAAVRKIYEADALLDETLAVLNDANVGERAAGLERDLQDEVATIVRTTLADAGVSSTTIDNVLESYWLSRDAFRLTEDLADEQWNIAVILPGRIIGSNTRDDSEPDDLDCTEPIKADDPLGPVATKLCNLEDSPGFQAIGWTFDGDALRDRDVVLMATSFVPAPEE